MKKISTLLLITVAFLLTQTTLLFGQEIVADSKSIVWDFTSPVVYLIILAAFLTLLTIYTIIQVNLKLTELGYVENGSPSSTLRWTANNPTKVAVIIIIIVFVGIVLAI